MKIVRIQQVGPFNLTFETLYLLNALQLIVSVWITSITAAPRIILDHNGRLCEGRFRCCNA